jgi:GNAT superfamily N-acetyltransferase
VDFDPEFAGDDDAVRVQKRIFEQARWIAATKGLVSRGSRVGLLDAWRQSPQIAFDIAKKFELAVFSLKLDQWEQFTSRFREAGLGVSSFLHYSSQEAAFTRCDSILADNRPARYDLKEIRVDADTPRGIVAAAQTLMAISGLQATPGYFLRGLTQRNLSIVLVDRLDEPVGCAIAMDESSAGPDFVGSYFVGYVCVAPEWKGKGLGRWLNARAIQMARRAGSASIVHEGVSPANFVSQRMIASCGLTQDVEVVPLMATTMAIPEARH